MSRKRCHRRPVQVNPLAHIRTMQAAGRMNIHDVTTCAAALAMAIGDARRGVRATGHWREIFDAINTAGELVRMRIAQDEGGQIAALEALASTVMQRMEATGSTTLYSAEIKALEDFGADFAGLLSGVSIQELLTAQATAARRAREVLRKPEGHTVVHSPFADAGVPA